METLRTWALTIALAALAGGIVRLLTPKGSVEKSVRVVVAVFLLSAFLSPMFQRNGEGLDWLFPEVPAVTQITPLQLEIARQMQSTVETELTNRMQRVLDTRGLDGQILLNTDILSDGSIEIVTARVTLAQGGGTRGLAAALAAEAGFEVEIVTE